MAGGSLSLQGGSLVLRLLGIQRPLGCSERAENGVGAHRAGFTPGPSRGVGGIGWGQREKGMLQLVSQGRVLGLTALGIGLVATITGSTGRPFAGD